MNLRNILFFDAMLTPKVVTLVYWLLLVAALVAGIGSMFYTGFQYMTFGTFFRGLAHHRRRRHRRPHLVRARHRALQAERKRPAHRQFEEA